MYKKSINDKRPIGPAKNKTDVGLIYFGSTAPAVDEAIDYLSEEGYDINKIRIRSFPFDKTLEKFISENDHLFILEQNRDAQMKTLLMIAWLFIEVY